MGTPHAELSGSKTHRHGALLGMSGVGLWTGAGWQDEVRGNRVGVGAENPCWGEGPAV